MISKKKILIIFFSILFGITFSYLIPTKQAQAVIQTSSGAYLFIVNAHGLITIQEGGCDPSTLKKGYIDFENIDSKRTLLLSPINRLSLEYKINGVLGSETNDTSGLGVSALNVAYAIINSKPYFSWMINPESVSISPYYLNMVINDNLLQLSYKLASIANIQLD